MILIIFLLFSNAPNAGNPATFANADIIDNFEDIEPQVGGLVVRALLISRKDAYHSSPAKLAFLDVNQGVILEICFWKWKFEAAGVPDAALAISDLIYMFHMFRTYTLYDIDAIADDLA